LEEKLNLSYKDYTLTETDYFQGIHTILTSERAALKKVTELWKTFNEDNKWID
jgi:hypothetical protein